MSSPRSQAIGTSTILSLDIATRTGWALWRDAEVRYGVETFPSDIADYALAFERWLAETLTVNGVALLCVEAPLPVNRKTTQNVLLRAHGAHVIARKVCRALDIRFTSITPDQWRKFFIGVARAPRTDRVGRLMTAHYRRKWLKEAAMAKCEKLGFRPDTDDAADALGLLHYARAGERDNGNGLHQALTRAA